MKCTIQKLWNGTITPARNCGANDPEIKELIALMERNREALNKELNKQQTVIFEKYLERAEEYMYLISMHAFCDGFCLASKLMAESLPEKA